MFVETGGQWELAGINLYVGNYSGQPGSTAVFSIVDGTAIPPTVYAGDSSYMADLSSHFDQIPIPEPASTSAVAGALCLLGAAAYRFRHQA